MPIGVASMWYRRNVSAQTRASQAQHRLAWAMFKTRALVLPEAHLFMGTPDPQLLYS